jgi:hypothetical protein
MYTRGCVHVREYPKPMEPEAMNVFATELTNTGVTNTDTSAQPQNSDGLVLTLVILVPVLSAVLILFSIRFLRKRDE